MSCECETDKSLQPRTLIGKWWFRLPFIWSTHVNLAEANYPTSEPDCREKLEHLDISLENMVKTHTAARARIQMWTFYSTILPYLKTCTVFMKTIHVCCKVFLKWSFRHIFVICIGKFYPVCTMSVEYYYCPIENVDKTVKIHPFLNRVVKYYTCTHFYFIIILFSVADSTTPLIWWQHWRNRYKTTDS